MACLGAALWRYHSFVLFAIVLGLLAYTQWGPGFQRPQTAAPTIATAPGPPVAPPPANQEIASLTGARDEAAKRVQEAQQEQKSLRERIHYLTPLTVAHLRDRISHNENELTKLRAERIRLDNSAQTINKALAAGIDRDTVLAAVLKIPTPREKDLEASGAPRNFDESLALMQLQEKDLLEVLGPEHPDVVELRKRMDWIRLMLRVEGKTKGDAAPAKKVHALDLHLQVIERDIEANEKQTQYVAKLIEEDRKTLGELNALTSLERTQNEDYERLQKELAACEERLRAQLDGPPKR
jgi:hypothetical protein